MEEDSGQALRALFIDWFRRAIGSPPDEYQITILTTPGPFIINKSRQVGMTTVFACLAVFYAGVRGSKVLILSNSKENATHIIEYAREFINAAPIEKPDIDQQGKIILPNGGEIRSLSTNYATARGYPANLVIMDEFAHLKGELRLDEKLLYSVAESTSAKGGRLIISSTPLGMTGMY